MGDSTVDFDDDDQPEEMDIEEADLLDEEEDENVCEAGQVQHQQQDTDGYSLGN